MAENATTRTYIHCAGSTAVQLVVVEERGERFNSLENAKERYPAMHESSSSSTALNRSPQLQPRATYVASDRLDSPGTHTHIRSSLAREQNSLTPIPSGHFSK